MEKKSQPSTVMRQYAKKKSNHHSYEYAVDTYTYTCYIPLTIGLPRDVRGNYEDLSPAKGATAPRHLL